MLVTEYKITVLMFRPVTFCLANFIDLKSYISLVRDSPHYLRMIFYQEKATESESA